MVASHVRGRSQTRRGGQVVEKGILLPKLFGPTVRKTFEIREFENFLRSLEQFVQTVKGQNNFW